MMRPLFLALTLFFLIQPQAQAKPLLMTNAQEVRCGYVEYMPGLMRDATGMRGFDYEIMQEVGARLQLQIQYTNATSWAGFADELRSRRFDMLCSGFMVHPRAGKLVLFSRPIFYQPFFVVVRANENRIGPETNLNNPGLTMAALAGGDSLDIAASSFPAVRISILQTTDPAQTLAAVANNGADFAIVDGGTFGAFEKTYPGRLRLASPDHPIRVYPVSFVFGEDDVLFRGAVSAALEEMLLDGTIDLILNKYAVYPNSYYRVETPYIKR